MGGSWKVILAFVGVFMAGAVFGGFFTARSAGRRWAEREARLANQPANPVATQPPAANNRPPNNPNRAFGQITPVMLQRLATQLKLTDDQKDKIKPIVTRAEEDMLYLRKENFRSTARVLERMHADIGVLLTEQQRTDLEVLKKAMKERMERAEKERRDELRLRNKDQTGMNRASDAAAATTPAPAPKGN